MNNKEAIENLKYLISGDCCDTQMDYVDEIDMAIEALEKQIPKEPIKLKARACKRCPVCKNNGVNEHYK